MGLKLIELISYITQHYITSKQWTMQKAKLKIKFFESEIVYMLTLQQQLQTLKTILKESIPLSDPKPLLTNIKQIARRSSLLKQWIHYDNVHTKLNSDLLYDDNRYEGEFILRCVEEKVEDLNQRLYVAESGVQRAEAEKKIADQTKTEYTMSNIKPFKNAQETKVINQYLKAESNIIRQYKRSINLMMRIGDKEKIEKTGRSGQFRRLLDMRANGLGFTSMRRLEGQAERRGKSVEKWAGIDKEPIKNIDIREPIIPLLLKSQHTPYRKQRQQSIKSLLVKLRENNKKYSLQNKLLTRGLQFKDHEQVLKYLESKQQLNEQESIMKIQLMAQKLGASIEERLFCLKLGRKSKEFGGKEAQKNEELGKERMVKSLEKITKAEQKQKTPILNNKKQKIAKQYFEKPFTSNPKTNDSLSNGNVNF